MFGEWKLHFFSTATGNRIAVVNADGEILVTLWPGQLDQAWAMVHWRNDVARRARLMAGYQAAA